MVFWKNDDPPGAVQNDLSGFCCRCKILSHIVALRCGPNPIRLDDLTNKLIQIEEKRLGADETFLETHAF